MITGYKDWKTDMESRYDFWKQKNSEGIVITDPTTTSYSNSTVGRNIHKEDKDSKFYWSKDWKITPPTKIKTNGGTVDNIIVRKHRHILEEKMNLVIQLVVFKLNIIKWVHVMFEIF
ncbi:hypothetical protein [Spiroplasma endosymbiont of Phyllotreta cruciferae]|uniref:hypothetical protein n=1 Tax=Spiroplasma endosymbiont of Phyllotreta cruciferae TaxID=2886375 RepID=UPI00209D79DC|nr:hypothetical protein [Spiroplasma endosymbiont of Phyllotreta cruciferae]